ncbi:MAG: adenine deaminase [Proteobacteria bacterium]|nr:adenine deaminase [Pseudomonadota bacterium]
MRATLERRIDQGRGVEPADVVIRNGRFLDIATGALVESDIAITGDTITGTFGSYEGREIIDAGGRIIVPGFIDTHTHVESSLLTPEHFDECILPYGVTTVICDPHEIANVIGAEGIRYFLDSAETLVMDLRVNLSSCVPATHLETAGARLDAADLLALADHPKVIGLAEFMNFPGVLHKDPVCMEKLAAFAGGHIDGHAPLLRGRDLNGYLAAGIRTDHECTSADEAREKLSKGMNILIREGSVSKDLHALAPMLTERSAPFCAFCTDDRNPLDVAEEGHLDFLIRTAISLGVPVLAAYCAASWSAARIFGLMDRGMIAPGWRADLVLLDGPLETCRVADVIAGGRAVTPERFAARRTIRPVGRRSMKARTVKVADMAVPARNGETPVIGVVPGRIITDRLSLNLPQNNGEAQVDPAQDVVKVVVVERHGRSHNGEGIGRGFVKGFGMKRGAIASSVGHDSHNICVVGADDTDMALAANRLGEIEGGFVVAEGGRILAELPLPVAGLMSLEGKDAVREQLVVLRRAAKSLGVTLAEPFLQVAFLPLPVIPHLKISDKGLVDVDRFELIGEGP